MPSRLVRPGLTRILKTYPQPCISYSSTQRTSAALPDVPMRIISPRPVQADRPSWPPALAKVDAAHRALVTRFPQGQFVTADGATHQWLPFERPDVVIDARSRNLPLNGS